MNATFASLKPFFRNPPKPANVVDIETARRKRVQPVKPVPPKGKA